MNIYDIHSAFALNCCIPEMEKSHHRLTQSITCTECLVLESYGVECFVTSSR